MCTICMVPAEVRRRNRSPKVRDDCEPSCMCWELNLVYCKVIQCSCRALSPPVLGPIFLAPGPFLLLWTWRNYPPVGCSSNSFFKVRFYVCVFCMYIGVCWGKSLRSSELEVQAIISHLIWVLEMELGPSARHVQLYVLFSTESSLAWVFFSS